jgi:hypothetical protein
VGHRHNPLSEQSKGNETLFPIVKALTEKTPRTLKPEHDGKKRG